MGKILTSQHTEPGQRTVTAVTKVQLDQLLEAISRVCEHGHGRVIVVVEGGHVRFLEILTSDEFKRPV